MGSFVTTAALRSADKREWAAGRSSCDSCAHTLGFNETVPLISFVWLGGRCHICKAKIGPLPFGGELAGLIITVGALAAPQLADQLWLLLAGYVLLFISVFDIRTLRIPDWASLLVLVLGLATAALGDTLAIGAATSVGVYAILSVVKSGFKRFRRRDGLGGGDVKLLAALAAWLGPTFTPWALVTACALALFWIRLRNAPSSASFPFGPFIAIGAWTVALAAGYA